MSLSVPLPSCCNICSFWVLRRLCGAQKNKRDTASEICLKIMEDLRQILERRSLRGLSPFVAITSFILSACLVTARQSKQEQCGGGRWVQAGKAFSHFRSSLFFLLIASCSGKIIFGACTAAWTTEVLAVTCPLSGLVHRWQFFGKTVDPTETCIGSSHFVLLLCLNFLWFASHFNNSQQSITICITIWRSCVLFWEEFKSTSTLYHFV